MVKIKSVEQLIEQVQTFRSLEDHIVSALLQSQEFNFTGVSVGYSRRALKIHPICLPSEHHRHFDCRLLHYERL